MNSLHKYFPSLSSNQRDKLDELYPLYQAWNAKINVISRNDMDNFYINHVLHSLAIAKIIDFKAGTNIMDVGTGGGFPGIPLAIMFPESNFYLIDSIGKKIRVVNEVIKELGLRNVVAEQIRAENVSSKFDFVTSRGVTAFPRFVDFVKHSIKKKSENSLNNGIIYLKGGEFEEEIKIYKSRIHLYNISDSFKEDFFQTKKIIHLEIN